MVGCEGYFLSWGGQEEKVICSAATMIAVTVQPLVYSHQWS